MLNLLPHTQFSGSPFKSLLYLILIASVKSDLFSTKSFDLRGKQFNHVEAPFSPATSIILKYVLHKLLLHKIGQSIQLQFAFVYW